MIFGMRKIFNKCDDLKVGCLHPFALDGNPEPDLNMMMVYCLIF
jgi:hypothetical protein